MVCGLMYEVVLMTPCHVCRLYNGLVSHVLRVGFFNGTMRGLFGFDGLRTLTCGCFYKTITCKEVVMVPGLMYIHVMV